MYLSDYQLRANFVSCIPLPPPPVLVDYFEVSYRHNILFVNVSVSHREIFKKLFAQMGGYSSDCNWNP